MGCRCAIVSQMLYHRCVAGKPVVCEFSTRFLFCEGCCLVVRIAIYVPLTGFGFLLLCSRLADGAGPWTVNTSVICNQTLCNFVMEGDRGCVPIFWEAELLSPTLPSSLLILLLPPHPPSPVLSTGNKAGAFTTWEAVCIAHKGVAIIWGLWSWQPSVWLRFVRYPLNSISRLFTEMGSENMSCSCFLKRVRLKAVPFFTFTNLLFLPFCSPVEITLLRQHFTHLSLEENLSSSITCKIYRNLNFPLTS